MKTTIIAEIGVNHNGCLSMASELVKGAAAAGADIVKFQTFTADAIATSNAKLAGYQLDGNRMESQHDLLTSLELSRADHRTLKKLCESEGVEFLSSGFDQESLEFLEELGVLRWKVPSGEITNLPYLEFIGKTRRPVIMSTGMASMGDIERAIGVLSDSGMKRDQLTLLQCTTEYPTHPADINLNVMGTLRHAFGVAVGFSDHSEGIEVALAAVALGATVIEKHITLDRALPGPDHKASLVLGEFSDLVRGIRKVESALGSAVKVPTNLELDNRLAARKSIVAKRSIRKGDVLNKSNIDLKRPGDGIPAEFYFHVLGTQASRDYSRDEQIESSVLSQDVHI
jgi:N,N'-diacetyllegionaminate synthase